MWKYYVLRLAYLLLGRLPLRALYAIARIVGDGAFWTRPSTRRAVASNMRWLLGPEASEEAVRRATREVFRNVARYYADLLYIRRVDVGRFYEERFEVEGEEYLHEAQRAGRGAIVVGAHFGNPEMAVQALAAKGFSFMGLVEPLEPRALSDFTLRLRSHHGHYYRTVGYSGLKETIQRLKSGGFVAILLDRDVTGTGVPMQFCGAEASIPLGAAELALRTGAALIPAKAWRLPGYAFKVQIEPPLEIVRTGDFDADARANVERILPMLEEQLRTDPGQWAVLESIWKERPDPGSEVQ